MFLMFTLDKDWNDFDGDYGVNIDGEDLGFQSYNEISSSLSNVVLDSLISQSQYNYPNINTDFTKFENHTFFGSKKITKL